MLFFIGYEKDQKACDGVAQINVCRPTAQINLQFRFHIHTILTRTLTDFTLIYSNIYSDSTMSVS